MDTSPNPPSTVPTVPAAPPLAATIVKHGKTESELLATIPKLIKTIKVTAAQKRKVEIKNAELADENHQLKQALQPPASASVEPAKEKRQWMGFTE